MAVITLGFVALIAAGATAGYTVWRDQDNARWVEHSYRVIDTINRVRTLEERLETARRGFLIGHGGHTRETFNETARAIPGPVEALGDLTRDNPSQQIRVGQLQALAAQHLTVLGKSMALAVSNRPAAQAGFESDGGTQIMAHIRRLTDDMAAEEARLLHQRTADQQASVHRLIVVLSIAGALLLIVAILSIAVIRRYTTDLIRSRDAVGALNAELEARVDERTRDLSRANEEIQRFAYIVSHDLRSPLVNVMGFTGELEAATKALGAQIDALEEKAPELIEEEARVAAREDLPESIGFIRASTQKMDRLINSILKLSREGKRNLAPETLDLAQIAEGIVATLQHRLDEIGAEVRIERPMPPLVSDRLAVEQMLSNLIENSVKYLKPGRPGRIVVSARQDGQRVAIEVADNGRGIDPKDHQRVFDLFRRSGQQDQPGEGIGLAHVRALAYRLGGLVDCRSALDQGATFTISLPARPPAPKEKDAAR